MSAGTIYILINPALKGLLKIGKTTRTAEERAKEISNATGVPTRYLVAYEAYTENCNEAERLIHSSLAQYRYEKGREFFALDLKDAIPVVIDVVQKVNVTRRRDIQQPPEQYSLYNPQQSSGQRYKISSSKLKRQPTSLPEEPKRKIHYTEHKGVKVVDYVRMYLEPEYETDSDSKYMDASPSNSKSKNVKPSNSTSLSLALHEIAPPLPVTVRHNGFSFIHFTLFNQEGIKITNKQIEWVVRTKIYRVPLRKIMEVYVEGNHNKEFALVITVKDLEEEQYQIKNTDKDLILEAYETLTSRT